MIAEDAKLQSALHWSEVLPDRVSGAAVWIVSPDDAGASLPPSDRHDDAAAFARPPQERPAFLRRRAALRALVARQIGVPPDAVSITAGPDGVPRLLAPAAALHVSISHRRGFTALAVARARIGVDLEPLDEPAEPAWNILTEAERRRLVALPESERWMGFLHYWTAKEAYLKAIGTGLWREPREIEVGDPDGRRFRIFDLGKAVPHAIAEHRCFTVGGVPLLAACVVLGADYSILG